MDNWETELARLAIRRQQNGTENRGCVSCPFRSQSLDFVCELRKKVDQYVTHTNPLSVRTPFCVSFSAMVSILQNELEKKIPMDDENVIRRINIDDE